MSTTNRGKEDTETQAEASEEVSEADLETVAGGILIGLNQPTLSPHGHKELGHKDLQGQLSSTPDRSSFGAHKLMKK